MIFFLIICSALAAFVGYKVGFDKGKVALEAEILHAVVNSPEYDHLMVDTFLGAFNKIRSKP